MSCKKLRPGTIGVYVEKGERLAVLIDVRQVGFQVQYVFRIEAHLGGYRIAKGTVFSATGIGQCWWFHPMPWPVAVKALSLVKRHGHDGRGRHEGQKPFRGNPVSGPEINSEPPLFSFDPPYMQYLPRWLRECLRAGPLNPEEGPEWVGCGECHWLVVAQKLMK